MLFLIVIPRKDGASLFSNGREKSPVLCATLVTRCFECVNIAFQNHHIEKSKKTL
jgi:hypothetical protein